MHSEDDLLPLSALQHLVFCPRQCMLIHLEAAWAENRHTAEGRLLHERVHERQSGTEQGIPVARGLRLVSYRLGLSGTADCVEYHALGRVVSDQFSVVSRPNGPAEHGDSGPEVALGDRPSVLSQANTPGGIELPGRTGRWIPYPIEYKRGRPKAHDADTVQLCAQALCIEEMLNTAVPVGALFYGATHRRVAVTFDTRLRARVEQLARQLHALFDAGATPPPEPGTKCKHCSLREQCVPHRPASASAFVTRMIREASSRQSPPTEGGP